MKTLKNIKYFFVCFIVLVLEMTTGKYLAVSGTVPMLSFSLCLAIAAGEDNADYIITLSVIMGVLLDFLTSHGFGSYTVTFLLASWAIYSLKDSIFSSKLLFLIFGSFILSIICCIIYYLFHILNVGINFWLMISDIALPTALYNTVISVILYLFLKNTIYKRR